jgi:hypothetical protein
MNNIVCLLTVLTNAECPYFLFIRVSFRYRDLRYYNLSNKEAHTDLLQTTPVLISESNAVVFECPLMYLYKHLLTSQGRASKEQRAPQQSLGSEAPPLLSPLIQRRPHYRYPLLAPSSVRDKLPSRSISPPFVRLRHQNSVTIRGTLYRRKLLAL